jgi:outer membrane scaffolding protein for murein synthesis (MipA/OmpV family)
MKNACVAVVVGLVMTTLSPTAVAQTVQGGIKAGVNFANVPTLAEESDTEGVDSRYRKGIVVGGFATVLLTDWLAFQPEVLYTQKGVEFKETALTNASRYTPTTSTCRSCCGSSGPADAACTPWPGRH